MAKREGTKVWTNRVRLAFVFIDPPKKKPGKGGVERDSYEVTLIIAKSDKDTIRCMKEAFSEALQDGIQKKFGGKRPPNLTVKYKDGDTYFDLSKYPMYKDSYVLGLTSSRAPGLCDRYGVTISNLQEIYSGCYARVTFNAAAYVTEDGTGKGVTAYIQNIQKLEDGEYLGVRAVGADEDFEAWEDENEDNTVYDFGI